MVDFTEVNYLAVLLAAAATMIIGFLWYSPILFGNVWMKQIGLKAEDMSGGRPYDISIDRLNCIMWGVYISRAVYNGERHDNNVWDFSWSTHWD
jgi:hypothetical protein